MNENDFVELNEHLREFHPIIEDFCLRNQFISVARSSLGRYPRIRIERGDKLKIWFDLQMGLDREGRRFERFLLSLPYQLDAGAYIDNADGSQYGERFQKSINCFNQIPFTMAKSILFDELVRHLVTLESWDSDFLQEHGQRIQLGR